MKELTELEKLQICYDEMRMNFNAMRVLAQEYYKTLNAIVEMENATIRTRAGDMAEKVLSYELTESSMPKLVCVSS